MQSFKQHCEKNIAPLNIVCFFFFYRCEEETSEKDFSPVQDLLGLIASFTLLGKTELKVALCVSNPQPPGFKFDPPLTTGTDAPHIQKATLHM